MDLKPCPFCGELPDTWTEPGLHYVGCTNIGICFIEPSVGAIDEEDSATKWNRRASPSEPTE